ncbi:MAG: response regulator [Myxococcales bacterium]|nr:MAG: response regulator [Myxococcales bacterium]
MIRRTDTLLLVEDSPDDYEAVARTLKKLNFGGTLEWVEGGEQALEFIDRALANDLPPVLVLLDLNMPGMDGRAVLRELKSNDRSRAVPVVIYTTSNNPADVAYCYQHFANSYHVKPLGSDALRSSLETVLAYWFELVVRAS